MHLGWLSEVLCLFDLDARAMLTFSSRQVNFEHWNLIIKGAWLVILETQMDLENSHV